MNKDAECCYKVGMPESNWKCGVKALKRSHRGSYSGNQYDIVTGEEYWISGIKKDGKNRHQFGSGKIMIDADAVELYLHLTGNDCLDSSKFEVVDSIQHTDPAAFTKLVNMSPY